MQITFDTSTASTAELTALMALCASLGGRLGALPAEATSPATARATIAAEFSSSETPLPKVWTPNDVVVADGYTTNEDAPPPPPVVVDTTLELDVDGIPWDARIHASTKTKTKAGIWTKLRNVNEVLYGQVHAELQEKYAAGNSGSATLADAPPPPTENTAVGSSANGAGVSSQDNSASNDAPPPPPNETGNAPTDPVVAANAPVAGSFADFPAFVQAVNALKPTGIPYMELNTYAQTLGVAGGFKDMKDKPELWGSFVELAGA